MSLIVVDDCAICRMPNVSAINSMYIHKHNIQKICADNGLEYTKDSLKILTKHLKTHVQSATSAIANTMLQSEAVKLKDTVVEAAAAMDQIDDISTRIFEMMLSTDDVTEFHRLSKNYSDMLKRKHEYLNFLYKATGGKTKAEVTKAIIMDVIKVAREEMGEERYSVASKKKSVNMDDIYMSNPRVQKALKDAGMLHDAEIIENDSEE